MTTSVTIINNNGSKVIVEVWQTNHIMGQNTRVDNKLLDHEHEITMPVWSEQYFIVREARTGELI